MEKKTNKDQNIEHLQPLIITLLWYSQRLNSPGTLLESLHFRLCQTLKGQISLCLRQVHLQLEGNIEQMCVPCASYKSAGLLSLMLCKWVYLVLKSHRLISCSSFQVYV